MNTRIPYKSVLVKASIICAALGVFLVLAYIMFGHLLIETMYDSNLSIVQQIMSHRGSTSLQNYFAAYDKAVLRLATLFILSALALLLTSNPLGLALSGLSFIMASLATFLLLDLVPELVKPLHFDVIPYYSYRLTYLPDPVLGFRARPFHLSKFTNYRGGEYSPLFGIDVTPQSGLWQTDSEGFRNAEDLSSAEVAIIGSSFVEWGNDVEDTYPMKLEKKLGGQKVVNLGKSGYGPLQYVELLKRYAIEKKPRYVIITFYPESDTDEQLANWVRGKTDRDIAKYTVGYGRFFRRYGIALHQTSNMLMNGSWTALQLGFRSIVGTRAVQPDLAVLRLPDGVTKRILFVNHHSVKSAENLLRSPAWQAMAKILVDFKRLCEQHQIVPLILYIPAASEVYAEYSTRDSGVNWLRVRKAQIATSGNNEEAARRLAQKAGIELISLLPAFKEAARQSKRVYYQLDVHWNAEGREIAARVTADALRALRSKAPQTPNTHKRKAPTDLLPLPPGAQQAIIGRKHAEFFKDSSVMRRAPNGIIESWNRRAEELYGWSKEEAIGKISHNLLKTKFPEPLAKINAEFDKTGEWAGKLVHTTRDGRRVVVESRWILDTTGDPGSVLEINRRSTELSHVAPDKHFDFSHLTVSR